MEPEQPNPRSRRWYRVRLCTRSLVASSQTGKPTQSITRDVPAQPPLDEITDDIVWQRIANAIKRNPDWR